jgi:hypothetical protein
VRDFIGFQAAAGRRKIAKYRGVRPVRPGSTLAVSQPINTIHMNKVFKRFNVLLFRTTAINRLIEQAIFQIVVLLRLNYRITLPIS